MEHRISKEWPPNIEQIDAVLKVRSMKGVMFAYAWTIYNPSGRDDIPVWLIEHERVHFRQQDATPGGAEAWWHRYLYDVTWRLSQEVEAYRRDYEVFRANNNRGLSRAYLRSISNVLSGRLYGNIVTAYKAKTLILDEGAE